LQGRRPRALHVEVGLKIERLEAPPPGVEVVDQQLHDEVPGPVLLEAVLQDEARRPHFEDGDVGVEGLPEAERLVKTLARGKVLGWKKGPRLLASFEVRHFARFRPLFRSGEVCGEPSARAMRGR
jgi:hypothetical protein